MNKFQKILYSIIGGVTLTIVTPLCIWVGMGTVSSTNQALSATLTPSETSRKEYLVGEKFDYSTFSLSYGDKTFVLDDKSVQYDFSTAGNKAVTFKVTEGDTSYEAKYYVEVFKATTLDVSNYEGAVVNLDGTVTLPNNISVVANLSGKANEFTKDTRFPSFDQTCFILSKDNYSVSALESSSFLGYYDITLTAGGSTFSWVYSATEDHPDVSSTARMFRFSNAKMDNKYLTLFVTYSSTCFTGIKTCDVLGTYVYRTSSGTLIKTYHFKYHLEGWTSSFLSEETYGEGLKDSQGYGEDLNAMKVEITNDDESVSTYYASGGSWHNAVFGG